MHLDSVASLDRGGDTPLDKPTGKGLPCGSRHGQICTLRNGRQPGHTEIRSPQKACDDIAGSTALGVQIGYRRSLGRAFEMDYRDCAINRQVYLLDDRSRCRRCRMRPPWTRPIRRSNLLAYCQTSLSTKGSRSKKMDTIKRHVPMFAGSILISTHTSVMLITNRVPFRS
jgi:hypothetical protein